MSDSSSNFSLLILVTAMLAVTLPALGAEQSPQTAQSLSDQQQGMDENLVDTVPVEDQATTQQLQNPSIIVHENLQEIHGLRTSNPNPPADEPSPPQEPENIGRRVLDKSNAFMDFSRRPFTYIQGRIPFFTERNIVFFGRLELDYAEYSEGVLEDDSGIEIRRFRLGLAGQVKNWSSWNYKFEVDLTDGENTLSDTYISRHSSKWGTIRIGNQKVAQTLSGQTSSVSIPFMERPLPILAFTLKRRLGVGWELHKKRTGVNVTVFGMDPNEDIGSHGWAARGYFNPSKSQLDVIHIGGSFMQLFEDGEAQFRARPESNRTDIRLVDTGEWPEVKYGSALGLEIAGSRGPVTFRSEYYVTDWSRSDKSRPRFEGWYAEVSWFLTGEMAHYREGKFVRPNIKSDRGAWEMAVRYSYLNLNDKDVKGGEENNLTLGINWYSKAHWRFMGNLIKVRSDGPYGEEDPWIVQFRAQYYF